MRYIAGALLMGVGFVGFWIGVMLLSGAVSGGFGSGPEWSTAERFGGGALGLVLQLAMGAAFLFGRRLAQDSAADKRAADPRAPVLLLRSFARDGATIDSMPVKDAFLRGMTPLRRDRMTLEELLVSQLETIGPVIAIGRPGEKLAPVGAGRLYVEEDWKKEVLSIAERAALIALVVDLSPGLRWEISEMLRLHPQKLLVLLPPPELRLRKQSDRDAWEALRAEIASLPPHDDRLVGVAFDARGAPRAIRSAEPDVQSQSAALEDHLRQLRNNYCPKCANACLAHDKRCAWCGASLAG